MSPGPCKRLKTLYAEAGYPGLMTACAPRGMQPGPELFGESVATGKVVDRPDALVSFEALHGRDGEAAPIVGVSQHAADRG